MGAVKVLEDGTARVRVRSERAVDSWGRPIGRMDDRGRRVVDVVVAHHDDYGVLCTFPSSQSHLKLAEKALEKLGYDLSVFRGGYRPCMVDQAVSAWPRGLWVGGTCAIAFYFEIC